MRYATNTEVEDAVFVAAKEVFTGVIGGNVYNEGTRPMDSDKEDIVVVVSTGTTAQVQEFSAYVNVYVPDIRNSRSGNKVKNRKRLTLIESYQDALTGKFNELHHGVYEARLFSATRQMAVPEVEQHCVSFNLLIRCLTFNLNNYGSR